MDGILIPSCSFIPNAERVIGEGYPFRLYSIIISMLRAPAHPSLLKNPRASFYYLQMLLQELRLLLAQIIEM
jgi:hypothetical protein